MAWRLSAHAGGARWVERWEEVYRDPTVKERGTLEAIAQELDELELPNVAEPLWTFLQGGESPRYVPSEMAAYLAQVDLSDDPDDYHRAQVLIAQASEVTWKITQSGQYASV